MLGGPQDRAGRLWQGEISTSVGNRGKATVESWRETTSFGGAFEKSRKAWKNSAPTGRSFMKFDI